MRVHLAIFALCALLPAWILAGVTLLRLAQTDRANLVREARTNANAIAYVAERELASLRSGLLALGGGTGFDIRELESFAEQVAGLRRIGRFEVLVIDGERRVRNSSGGPNRAGAIIPSLGEGARLDGGPMAAGLVKLPDTDQYRLIVEAPVASDPAEGPGPWSLVFVTEPIALWSAAIETIPLTRGWHSAIIDGNDAILAHAPMSPNTIGTSLRAQTSHLFRTPESSSATSGWQRNPIKNGEVVYTAWHRIEGTRWVALVGVPADQVDGMLRNALVPILIGGALVLPLTIFLAWWGGRHLIRPLSALSAAASAIARGESPPVVNSGVRELDVLAASLAAAADERRARETERLLLATRLENVLDSTADGVVMLDTEGRFTFMNPRAEELLGRADKLMGRDIVEAFPMSPDNPLRAALLSALLDRRKRSVSGLHPNRALWLAADYYPSPEGLTIFFRDVSAAKAAEAAMRQGEMRLKAVLDSLPVGVLLAEAPSGRILLGNRRMEEITRHPLILSPDMAHYGEWALSHADGRPVTPQENPLSRVLATGASAAGDFRYRRGDGTATWIRLVGAPTFDAGGRLSGAVLACTEIAEERRAAEALRASEQRFRTLAAAVPQIVWSALPDGVVDYVNPRFAEFTGLTGGAGQVDPSPGGTACHPQDVEGALSAWHYALENGEPFAAEYRLRAADGGWRWFTARALPVTTEHGRITRWIGAATDVTDLITARVALENQVLAEAAARQAAVAAAEALAASEERFRRFAEASPDVMWIADTSGEQMEYISPAFERIWGESSDALLMDGALWGARIHPDDRAAAMAAWKGEWPNGRLLSEYRIARGDGAERWVRVLGFPILDSTGQPARRGGFVRDITAEKAADERQALLIGELNHRVKNTLATVHSLALQTARAAGTAPLPLDRFLSDFQARLLALSRGHDLLTARTWHGATMMEVARAALLPWQPAESDVGRLTIEGPRAWLAPKQALGLSLALHELATNAAKHGAISRPEGKLLLEWEWEEDQVVRLHWRERGGPPTKAPTRRGFGTRLLERGLPAELGPGSSVSLRYLPEGFEAVIRFRPIGRMTPREGMNE